jgi:hypothetical protein
MQNKSFRHLFSEKKSEIDGAAAKQSKKMILLLFALFFFFYLQYKPYSGQIHTFSSISEYIFGIYQFVINQTLGIVHEGVHGVCYILPCPKFLMVINGTLFQWLFPLGIAYYYKRKNNAMAFYAGLFILGISLDYSAWYMSTAHEGAFIPAVRSFLGVDAIHDFNYIFTILGVMPYASFISGITKVISVLLMFGSLIAMFFEAFSNKKEG